MKQLIVIAIALLAVAAFSERPTFSLQPLGLSTISLTPIFHMPLASKKDLLVYRDTSAGDGIVIRRRNSEGIYEQAANFSGDAPFFATNGKWIATLLGTDGASFFMIDANNQLSNVSTIDVFGGDFLSDDTFVGINSKPEGNFTLQSYEYNASSNNWTTIPGTAVELGNLKSQGAWSSYRTSDAHLVFVDAFVQNDYKIQVYERLADRTLKHVDTVPVNVSSEIGSVLYNDVDTLAYSFPQNMIGSSSEATGYVYIYTKINGVWTTQLFTADGLGYRELGFFGFNMIFADSKTLLISAAYDGHAYDSKLYNGGRVLLLSQNEAGLWEPKADLIGNTGLFGVGMALNDFDLLVAAPTDEMQWNGFPITFYVAPQCFHQPANITCKDQELNACTDVNVEDIFTLNNPECGTDIVAAMTRFSLVDNKAIEATVSVTKNFLTPVTCNATVTCQFHVTSATPTKVSNATPIIGEISIIAIWLKVGLYALSIQ